jgi:taurine dioxygenase
MPITVTPLSKALGAAIGGVDLSRELDRDTVAAIRTAWLDHVVIVFPGQTLVEEDQERFCRYFGELEVVRTGPAAARRRWKTAR